MLCDEDVCIESMSEWDCVWMCVKEKWEVMQSYLSFKAVWFPFFLYHHLLLQKCSSFATPCHLVEANWRFTHCVCTHFLYHPKWGGMRLIWPKIFSNRAFSLFLNFIYFLTGGPLLYSFVLVSAIPQCESVMIQVPFLGVLSYHHSFHFSQQPFFIYCALILYVQ